MKRSVRLGALRMTEWYHLSAGQHAHVQVGVALGSPQTAPKTGATVHPGPMQWQRQLSQRRLCHDRTGTNQPLGFCRGRDDNQQQCPILSRRPAAHLHDDTGVHHGIRCVERG